jgi:hypothetical protein
VAQQRKVKPPSRGHGLRTFGTSTFHARLHLEDVVRGADGQRYRLRLARTGVRRRLIGAPINHILSDLSWARYLSSADKTWTLSVVYRSVWGDKTVLEEVFDNREDGATRGEEVVQLLMTDEAYGAGLRQPP